jgi:hypothetical protein
MDDKKKAKYITAAWTTGGVIVTGAAMYFLMSSGSCCRQNTTSNVDKGAGRADTTNVADTAKKITPPKVIIIPNTVPRPNETIENKVVTVTDHRNREGLFGSLFGKKNKSSGSCTYQCPTNDDILMFYAGSTGKNADAWYENNNGDIRTVDINTARDRVRGWSTISSITTLEAFETKFGPNYRLNGTPKVKQMTEQERESRNRQNYAPGYEPKSGFSKIYLKQSQQFKGRR